MAKLHDMQAIYAQELRGLCGIVPDMVLLDWVVRALGPLALAPKSAQISAQDDPDLTKAVASFMARHHLPAALAQHMVLAVKDSYPSPQRYRAVVAYLIAQNFGLRGRSTGP
jgi:hypothetical protein